jgi:hypothetical protein
MTPHPDAALLDLCRLLGEQQKEWQRLWTACEEDGSAPEADERIKAYEDQTWPGIRSGSSITPYSPDDLPQKLITARPTTPEGLEAMALAVLALEAAGAWADIRDDHCQILLAVVRAVAGVERMPIGDGSAPA